MVLVEPLAPLVLEEPQEFVDLESVASEWQGLGDGDNSPLEQDVRKGWVETMHLDESLVALSKTLLRPLLTSAGVRTGGLGPNQCLHCSGDSTFRTLKASFRGVQGI